VLYCFSVFEKTFDISNGLCYSVLVSLQRYARVFCRMTGLKCTRAICVPPQSASLDRGGVHVYAIIETGGKQYKVNAGDIIRVEKLEAEAGSSYSFDKVLLVAEGENVTLGAPYVAGATVKASVIGDGKEKKVIIYKYKSKKGFHKKKGHRQPFTSLKVEAINA